MRVVFPEPSLAVSESKLEVPRVAHTQKSRHDSYRDWWHCPESCIDESCRNDWPYFILHNTLPYLTYICSPTLFYFRLVPEAPGANRSQPWQRGSSIQFMKIFHLEQYIL